MYIHRAVAALPISTEMKSSYIAAIIPLLSASVVIALYDRELFFFFFFFFFFPAIISISIYYTIMSFEPFCCETARLSIELVLFSAAPCCFVTELSACS